MKRFPLAAATAAVLSLLVVPQLFAEYDRQAVVTLMRDNVSQLTTLNNAAKAGDYYSAALALVSLAENSRHLQELGPPGGSEETWGQIHGRLIRAAFRGVGACGAEDRVALKAAIQEIIDLRQQGHGTFR